MTRDFIIGLLLGILIAIIVLWLLEPSDNDGDDDDRARQGTPKYSGNVTVLDKAAGQ